MGWWLRDHWQQRGTNGWGAVLIHGFGGEPGEMLPLARYLADQGYSIDVPVLNGHGGVPHDLIEGNWSNWRVTVAAALKRLQTHSEQQIIVGFSMGGLLGLELAYHAEVAGCVTLATPMLLKHGELLPLLLWLRYLIPWIKPLKLMNLHDPQLQQQLRHIAPDLSLDDQATQTWLRNHVRLPLQPLIELLQGIQRVRRMLPQISLPTLVIHGLHDSVAPPYSATMLAHRLNGPVELAWFAQSNHQILLEQEAEQVCERVHLFLKQLQAKPKQPAFSSVD